MESNQPQFSSSPVPAPNGNAKIMAIASLVLGVINLCAWFLPICGIPLSLIGLGLGFFGMKDQSQKTLAIIGMVLCGLGLLAGCVNAGIGVYMGLNGNGFQFAP
ncbi:MAG: hypothetical protein HY863_16860 [Chloroflexi bacterium]|nr:hypothetical protein [Chloroflexota bacterium]